MQRTTLLAAFFVLSMATPFTASAEQASTTTAPATYERLRIFGGRS